MIFDYLDQQLGTDYLNDAFVGLRANFLMTLVVCDIRSVTMALVALKNMS